MVDSSLSLFLRDISPTPRILSAESLGGGCIASVLRLRTDDVDYVLKRNGGTRKDVFLREYEGLLALHDASQETGLRVPRPIASGDGTDGRPAFLLAEHVETGPRPPDFMERFGRAFALLHQRARGNRFGFPHDNYCGATPQENAWSDDWVDFFAERRLRPQLRLAERNGYGGELQRLGERLLARLPLLIAEPLEPPTLLHGDLWSGNFLCAADGTPVLIDPAAYYGRREADLAMTRLFGGFSERFYAAYDEVWPLADGWEERLQVYQLYHLLNHLNLFGGGYLEGCMVMMRGLL